MQTPIFYINLASRPDRRAFMEGRLTELGLAATRIEATGTDDIPQDLLDYHSGRSKTGRCTPGAIACSLSHAAVMRIIADSDSAEAIVLEDDVLLDPTFMLFTVPGLLERLGADLVKLETWRKPVVLGSNAQLVDTVQLRELASSHLGTAAYLISRRAAQLSLASPLLHRVPFDHFMFSMRGHHLMRSRLLQADPSPAVQMHKQDKTSGLARSDINPNRHLGQPSQAKKRLVPWWRSPKLVARHVKRATSLMVRDPATLFRAPVTVPFAGDAR